MHVTMGPRLPTFARTVRSAIITLLCIFGSSFLSVEANPCAVVDEGDVNPVRDCLNRPTVPGKAFVIKKLFEVNKPGIIQIRKRNDKLYVSTGLTSTTSFAQVFECSESGDCKKWFDVDEALIEATGYGISFRNWMHGGLRGITFHDNFDENGIFYSAQMQIRPNDTSGLNYLSDVENPIDADSTVTEWVLDGRKISPSSHVELLRIGMPVYDHPVKQLQFHDGWLYICHGDGSVQSATAGGGQNINDALGKVLRIRPNPRGSSELYSTFGNPWHGEEGYLSELYAVGFRNPHHIAISSTGQVVVADAGRDNIEEINCVRPGGNYGWSFREGTFVHVLQTGTLFAGVDALPSDDEGRDLDYPCAQWGHEGPVGQQFNGHAGGGGFIVENDSPLGGIYPYFDFPERGTTFYSEYTEMLNAKTRISEFGGNTSGLTQATTYKAVLVDADLEIMSDEFRTFIGSQRIDMRMGQAEDGTLFMTSKTNGAVYKVLNSVPGYVEKKYFKFPFDCNGPVINSGTVEEFGTGGKIDPTEACKARCTEREDCVGFGITGYNCEFRSAAFCLGKRAGSRDFYVQVPEYTELDGDCYTEKFLESQEVSSLEECQGLCAGYTGCMGVSFGEGVCTMRSNSCEDPDVFASSTFFAKPGASIGEQTDVSTESPTVAPTTDAPT